MPAPRPILSVNIAPLSADDQDRLLKALDEIVQTTPPFTKREQPSGEIVLAGESEAHLQAICALLRHDRNIDIAISPPQVIYLETILKPSDAEGKYIRQTGGSGNYGHVKIRLEPQDSGAGIHFINEIHGGVIPSQYIQPIEQGVREAAREGILTGHEMTDLKVTLYDGSHHKSDSNAAAFQIAASVAMQEAATKAMPILIEPWMSVDFSVSGRHSRAILQDISARSGRIQSVEQAHAHEVIKALVPLSEMLGYPNAIPSVVLARASHTMQFSHYARVEWPPDSDAANASVRNPREPAPRPHRAAVDPDSDWT
ncbi:MAG: hypothetical protein WA414_12055 [Acidobacteriaceae bacterium]